MMKHPRTASSLLAASAALSIGCGADVEGAVPAIAQVEATLVRAESCEDLERMLQDDAIAKMNAQIDSMIWSLRQYESGDEVTASGSSSSGGATTTTGGDFGDGEAAPPSDYSETNTQVEGVDEADIVKTDGNYLYLLHGQAFFKLAAWPASELAVESSIGIEGTPLEMYVDSGKVVVYSQVGGAAILEAAGLPARQPYYDYGYYGGPSVDYYYGYDPNPLTKVTVLDITGEAPLVQRELYFEGTYTSSRRVGTQVRGIVGGAAFGPQVAYWIDGPYGYGYGDASDLVGMYEMLRVKNTAAIRAAKLADWLPHRLVKEDGAIAALPPSCTDYYAPTARSTSYGLTQIHAIDLAAPESAPHETNVVGATDTIYSSRDTLVIAARAYTDPNLLWSIAELDTPVDTSLTHLHTFDLTAEPSRPTYAASGSVPGHVLDQFSIDEKDGLIRVATTGELAGADTWTTVSRVFVLEPEGGHLATIGAIGGLAEGEQIYSTRFVGDRGYVVTFRQVDPLFVIDLADPGSPKVVAELKIPGFSEYMQPLDEGHLLTIGRDGTESGQVLGLALQIFDVTDPAAPLLSHKLVYSGDDYGWSEATANHKAFTFFAERGLLAFPYVAYDYDGYGSMASTLQVFSVDAASGFQKLGAVDHTAFFAPSEASGYCGGYYGVDVRRGLFIDDFVYSISYGGVLVNDVADLATPVASLDLPSPTSDVYGCYY